ncbi:hypothetical protein CLOSTMETH_00102 [[Clostridium] methylpentosum DSM 5476]|uniref:Uncharacterized protein n=1 Tax=[Clostridium] methylpentosum DSM 5476 TaxID=537013 RepID=C0E8F7_9FIRM|nr:hypothetical protein CLOSTMETH_00102 [[Clostridium] methylpentosum DSM 5476]
MKRITQSPVEVNFFDSAGSGCADLLQAGRIENSLKRIKRLSQML